MEASLLAYSKGRGHKNKIPKSSRKMVKEKAYILGVMCGDGYLHRTKKDSYQVALQATDYDFVIYFTECMRKIYGLEPSISEIKAKKSKWNDKLCSRLCSKEVFEDILSYGKFGTKNWRVPGIIKESSSSIKGSFLRGFYDSEGSVDSTRKIIAVSTNKEGMSNITELLCSLGIRPLNIKMIEGAENRSSCYVVKITGKNYIDLFEKNVGFSIKRKRDKLISLIRGYKTNSRAKRDIKRLRGRMLLLRMENKSYGYIAKELNLPIATVWNNINRTHDIRGGTSRGSLGRARRPLCS